MALTVRQLLFGFVENAWVLSPRCFVLAGLSSSSTTRVSILVNAMAAKEVRASAQTLLLLVGQGMGPLFANLFTGRLAAHTGGNLQSVFLFAACLSGLATLVLVLRGRRLNDAGRALPR